MNVIERAKAPTPKFFRILRTIGLALLAISGSLVAAPVALPAVIVTVAGYAAVAGGVLSAVSQITVDEDAKRLQEENKNLPRDGIKKHAPSWNCEWNFIKYCAKYRFGRYCKNYYLSHCGSDHQFYGFTSVEVVYKIQK